MNRAKEIRIPFVYHLLLYACAFFLFLEWMYPAGAVGDTSNLKVFVIYTLFCFFISILQVRWQFSFLVKGFGLLFIIDGLFMVETFFSSAWFNVLYTEAVYNVTMIFSQDWLAITALFRTFLFLVLIWLMSYLPYYWFVVMKRVFVFVFLTFVYLAVLDTFTVYDAGIPILRTFIISFLVLGMANFFKEMSRESIRFPRAKRTAIWAIPMAAVVLFASVIGYAAPKFDPQWPDPVPFIQSYADNGGGSGFGSPVQKVGYGEDDSRLGGSFIQDDTEVFQAVVQEDHYWRIETKDVYTGKGWEHSADPEYADLADNQIPIETFADPVETEDLTGLLSLSPDVDLKKILYPYGIDRISTGENDTIQIDEASESLRLKNDAPIGQYSFQYDNPSFDLDALRELDDADPAAINDQYTQLPDELPARISELAAEIVEDETNRYDKAKAIEQYFGDTGFVYQISDVPVPDEEQDYVDQFLFDSQVGYCDNYSTSMVVMLRTLDIPARWVKGFTSGERVDESNLAEGSFSDDAFDVYSVTNSNAHSWVEVYFPETGWVPFEPTQGFANLADFHLDRDEGDGEDTETNLPELEEPELPEDPEPEGMEESIPAGADPDTGSGGAGGLGADVNWWYVGAGAAGLLALVWILFKSRYRWRTYFLSRKLMKKTDAGTYQEAYHHMLRTLDHVGLARKSNQTLREYAKRIDARYETDAMGRLTNYYELLLYKNEGNRKEAVKLPEIWKDFMKRIMA